MKHLIFLLAILLGFNSINAQTNRYSVAQTAKDNYYNTNVGNNYEDLYQLYQAASSIQERNEKVIDAMIDGLYGMQGQNPSEPLKSKLDGFMAQLKQLRVGSLLGDAEIKIKQIDWAIRDEIAKYKNSQNTSTSNTNVASQAHYNSGDLVTILPGGIFRDGPSVTAKQIGDDRNWPEAKILQMVNDRYYSVEVSGRTAYISPAFLGAKTKQDQLGADCNCELVNRPDGTITQCIPLPIGGDNSMQIGLGLASNRTYKYITLTIRYISGKAFNIIGNLNIRLSDNNLLTFDLINTQSSYIGNSDVENGVYQISDSQFNLLKYSNLLTVSVVLSDNRVHTIEASLNKGVLMNQTKCL